MIYFSTSNCTVATYELLNTNNTCSFPFFCVCIIYLCVCINLLFYIFVANHSKEGNGMFVF